MGLDQVVSEVRQDGEARAKKVLDDARTEATRIIAEAQKQAEALREARLGAARREAEQLGAQLRSGAEFEARKQVLVAERELRDELRASLLAGFAALPAKTREKHIKALLTTAKQTVPKGKAWCAKADKDAVAKGPYEVAGTLDIAGGLVVESPDGSVRLDLTYETLLGDMWRDVLKAEAGLFR